MVQPYWMLILELMRTRTRSQNVQNIMGTMLSTNSQAPELSEHVYSYRDPRVDHAHVLDCDDKPIFVQSKNEVMSQFSL